MPAQPSRGPGKAAPAAWPRADRVFATMAEAGAKLYVRSRDLPKLVALWPKQLADESPEGRLLILRKLRSALRAERRRAIAGHWSYDLNRHLGLLSAYKGEIARADSRPNRAEDLGGDRGKQGDERD